MANAEIFPIGSSNTLKTAAASGAASTISDKANSLADSLTKSLTGAGKAVFATPGAQQDFQNGMRSAVTDMMKGAESGDQGQITKGITALLGLLGELQKAQGKDQSNGSESSNECSPATAASGSSPATSGSSEDDKKKKLLELIQMLLSMGVSPEMIAQLLQSMGISSTEAQQLMNQASQGAVQGVTGNSANVQDPNSSKVSKNAIPA